MSTITLAAGGRCPLLLSAAHWRGGLCFSSFRACGDNEAHRIFEAHVEWLDPSAWHDHREPTHLVTVWEEHDDVSLAAEAGWQVVEALAGEQADRSHIARAEHDDFADGAVAAGL